MIYPAFLVESPLYVPSTELDVREPRLLGSKASHTGKDVGNAK